MKPLRCSRWRDSCFALIVAVAGWNQQDCVMLAIRKDSGGRDLAAIIEIVHGGHL